MSDLISRADAIEALGEEPEIWNDTEEEWAYHNAWVEHISALKALPSAEAPKPSGDLISRAEVHKTLSLLATEGGTDAKMLLTDAHEFIDILTSAEAVHKPDYSYEADMVSRLKKALSAEAVPQSEQYKKGFEDAKRAFLVEYARESKNMRKRNAQLEVMLNAQKAIQSADRPTGEWKQISPARIYECSECGQNVMTNDIEAYKFCHGCGAVMKGGEDE